jgi:hypothetical protein
MTARQDTGDAAAPKPGAAMTRRGGVSTTGWTEISDVIVTLRRRWQAGRYLRAYAMGEPWEPVRLPLRGPRSSEVLDRFEEIRSWSSRLESAAAGRFELEYRSVRGRNLGGNRVPARVRFESFDQLCRLLTTRGDVDALDHMLEATRRRMPSLTPWVAQHPVEALAQLEVWGTLLATVEWMATNDTSTLYLRQMDVEGVDTKFVERHRRLISDLLNLAAAGEAGAPDDDGGPAGGFGSGFGFRPKPSYTRFRLLDATLHAPWPKGLSELMLRTDELARIDLDVTAVFIVENEVSYLAFPDVPRALVVFGSGFAVSQLAALDWLAQKDVLYWGDIDTHGFSILNQLRQVLPVARSVLMDRETLIAHRTYWTTEPSPTRRPFPNLTAAEHALFDDLVTDRLGVGVRLEQERVRYSLVLQALEFWRDASGRNSGYFGRPG